MSPDELIDFCLLFALKTTLADDKLFPVCASSNFFCLCQRISQTLFARAHVKASAKCSLLQLSMLSLLHQIVSAPFPNSDKLV